MVIHMVLSLFLIHLPCDFSSYRPQGLLHQEVDLDPKRYIPYPNFLGCHYSICSQSSRYFSMYSNSACSPLDTFVSGKYRPSCIVLPNRTPHLPSRYSPQQSYMTANKNTFKCFFSILYDHLNMYYIYLQTTT